MATPFLWGAGGAKLTPEEIALQRSVLARRKAQGVDVSPIGSPLQGLARVVDALGDRYQEGQLNDAATENAKVNQDILTSLLGGGSPAASTGVAASLSPSSASPSNNGASTASQAAGVPPSVANSQPHELAASLVGKGEIPDRAVISEYLKNGGVNLDPATTAWCAAYVNSTLNQSGYKGTNSLAARSFLNYGTPVETPQKGDIAVFSRGNDPSLGHVGFFDSLNADGTIKILAGNQGDAVGYGIMSPDRLLGYRRPVPINGGGVVADMPTQPQTPVARPQVAQAQTVAPTNSLGVSPAVLQALTSPYANEQTKGVANLLLQQQQSQSAQQQKIALAEQQRQQEIARRQAIAQQSGIDPAYAADDDIWKAATANKFAPPSTSTVGANVIDNRTGKPIYQGTPESPTSVQEYEYAKGQGYEGSYAQYQSDMKRASANNTTINTGEGNKFYNVLDENNAKTFSGLSETGLQARSNLAQVDQLGKLLETTPTGATAALKQAAGEYGINTEGLSDIQAATALINKLVPAQRQPGSGSMSDQDLALFKQSLPRLINQPGSNATIVNTLKAISQYQIEQGAIADRVANREMTPAEARKAIAELPNPLAGFKPPAAGKENEGWKQLSPTIRIRPLGN